MKEFLVINNVLYVREATKSPRSFSPDGKELGQSTAVGMRPATKDEVEEYQKSKESK